MQKDDYVHILDFLPKGKSEMPPHKRKPVAQALGENFFSLLEVSPKENVSLSQGERVYIGEGTRDKIDHIERRIKYDWLTPTAKAEMPGILKSIVLSREAQYVNFYNTAGTISTRQHKLECLPKIGKRHRQDILAERESEPFKSFDNIRKRVKSIPDPLKTIVDKIIEELKGESKYYLFTTITDLKEKL